MHKMALFNRLFQSHKWKNGHSDQISQSMQTDDSIQSDSIFPFAKDQVRVLIFRECEWTGRRVLFDSSAVHEVSTTLEEQAAWQNNSGKSGQPATPTGRTDQTKCGATKDFIDICNGIGYVYAHTATDSRSMGEMIFGSVAMSFKGTSLKVHWLQDPRRILCSQVFLSPVGSRSSAKRLTSSNTTSSSGRSVSSDATDARLAAPSTNSLATSMSSDNQMASDSSTTIPLDVPTSFHRSSHSFSGRDSGYSDVSSNASNASYCYSILSDSDVINPRKLSIDSAMLIDATINSHSSDGSMQRRILRNMSTSLENQISKNDCIGYFSENMMATHASNSAGFGDILRRYSSEHSENADNSPKPSDNRRSSSVKPPQSRSSSQSTQHVKKPLHRRSKIGLAVCIRFSDALEDEMQLFCSEHIVLLESMLYRLRAAAEIAYANPRKFYQLMLHAWFGASTWAVDLFTAPRIREPVWLSLSNGYSDRPNTLAKHFMTELCWLLNCADTKDTNFFFSTLLTAILTNHLGWVTTVAPVIDDSAAASNIVPLHRTRVSELAKYHPYNVLWAQLGDLYGSVGTPMRLAKTIVCGAQTITINKLLGILTYFVRCGEIQRVRCKKVLDKSNIGSVTGSHAEPAANVDGDNAHTATSDDSQRPTKRLVRTKTYQKGISTIPSCSDLSSLGPPENGPASQLAAMADNEYGPGGIECSERTKYDETEAVDGPARKCQPTIKVTSDSHSNGANSIGGPANATDQLVWAENNVPIGVHVAKLECAASTTNAANDVANMAEVRHEPNHLGAISSGGAEMYTTTSGYSDSKGNFGDCNDGNSFDGKTDTPSHTIGKLSAMQYSNSKSATAKCSHTTFSASTHSSAPVQVATQHANGELNQRQPLQCASKTERAGTDPCNNNASAGDDTVDSDTNNNTKPSASVVFVLGDNEILSGLKPSAHALAVDTRDNRNTLDDTAVPLKPSPLKPNLPRTAVMPERPMIDAHASTSAALKAPPDNKKPACKKHCSHKKHSGVKFNFEQYPQIVTNYMKNKNLDITSYDFLEKGLKLEQENTFNYGSGSATMLPPIGVPDESRDSDEHVEGDECECCANTFRILQTPSNATELEFSNDDGNYPVPTTKLADAAASSDSDVGGGSGSGTSTDTNNANASRTMTAELGDGRQAPAANRLDDHQPTIKAPAESNNGGAFELLAIPIPKTIFIDEAKQRIRPGYVPSLFVGVTDHYIPDMVLQGITAPFSRWEPILKENLTLASHCTTFEQVPIENVAIIANIDKWDVKLVSSHAYTLSNGAINGAAGMSQLVSTMLETVHAMWLAGSSAYQCMAYLESKLKEIYLQSKTLAAFLLATEFCSLQTVTASLSLSANDVPLLLSVASIHSPQVTKKYGISFR